MADYAPPSGPPPPKVPEGWKAVWNDQYKEWFYVNIYTKQSQWDKPTEPVYASTTDSAPPPPSYDHNTARDTGPEKHSNNPFYQQQSGDHMSEDERMARQLQAEEQQRATSSRGASDNYYGQQPTSPYGQQSAQYGQQQLPPREEKKGFLGKLSSKLGSGSSSRQHYGGYPSHGYPQQGYPPQAYGQPYGGGYGGYPGYGPPGGGYGGYGGYGGGYPPRRSGGGLGAGGGAALGLGAGLLGGALIADGMNDSYDEGYDDGGGGDGGDGGGE